MNEYRRDDQEGDDGNHPLSSRALNPALAMAAPAKPLIIACEELVGKASHQVKMSHEIAPSSPKPHKRRSLWGRSDGR